MTTTVYFATNRAVNQPQDRPDSYTFNMVSPMRPQEVTYGTAFVDSANLTADTVGAIRSIRDIDKGGFNQTAIDDLSTGGRNILVFIHGFANSFKNAITRAAFNREWLEVGSSWRRYDGHCLQLALARPSNSAAVSVLQLSLGPDHRRPVRPASDELFRQHPAHPRNRSRAGVRRRSLQLSECDGVGMLCPQQRYQVES